jgi:glycosyltransferase involved in cell wall biosynthesis
VTAAGQGGGTEAGADRDGGPGRVAILMGTRNGARFLAAQLATIAAQSHRDWRLIVSDDGSTDDTRSLLAAFADGPGRGRTAIREGPRGGFAANFLSLAGDPGIRADFYAFADQDDLWHEDRLARGLARLAGLPAARPALAGGRTRLIDEEGAPLGLSPLFRARPAFENALVQSIAGGNTMLFNAAAKRLFEATAGVTVVAHDWWAYQLVSGAGGAVIYDPEPAVAYRQHGANLIGGNRGLRARTGRLRLIAAGRLAEWTDANLSALERAAPVLTAEARAKVALFRRARRLPLLARVAALRRLGLYRQTRGDTLALWLALATRLL